MGSEFPGQKMGRRSLLAGMAGAIGLLGLGGCATRSSQIENQSENQADQAANGGSAAAGQSGASSGKITLSSAAFAADGTIPAKHTCDGENLSPALSWSAPPPGTKSLAILASDPDAPGKTFVHWVLYDLPPDLRELPAGVPPNPLLSQGGVQGKSDFGKFGYGGPCPPQQGAAGTHRYVFKLYALDKLLDLPPGVSHSEVLNAMKGHTLAEAELVGRYRRP